MTEFFIPMASEKEILKEKSKARELRKTNWWRNKITQGECYYCGKIFKPEELTMDHVVPLIRGGKSTKNNIVPCCKQCNNEKKHKLPLEWAEYIENIQKQ